MSFRETYAPLLNLADIEDYIASHLTREAFAAIREEKISTLRILKAENQLVGYFHLRRSAPPDCVTASSPVELARIYLREDVIGRGHGKRLMRAAAAEARRQGGDVLWLLVYEKNMRALAFYRKWGFSEIGTAPFWFGGRKYFDPVMVASLV